MTLDQAEKLLTGAHERSRLAHSYLFTGPVGSGKRELAVNLVAHLSSAREASTDLWGEAVEPEVKSFDDLESEFVRVVRPRSVSRIIRVEQMRELEKFFHLSAPEGTWKVGVILDAERMGEEASNAFLKTLEEPPPFCLLLLLTAAPERLLPTILSRCVDVQLQDRLGLEARFQEQSQGMAQALASLAREGKSVWGSLTIKGAFDDAIAEIKNASEADNKAVLKEQTKLYKDRSEGKYLEEQEAALSAETAGIVLAARIGLVEWLLAWLGDSLRAKAGSEFRELPSQGEHSSRFGESLEVADLLRRADSLRELLTLLETNTQSALVLETSLMGAFA